MGLNGLVKVALFWNNTVPEGRPNVVSSCERMTWIVIVEFQPLRPGIFETLYSGRTSSSRKRKHARLMFSYERK